MYIAIQSEKGSPYISEHGPIIVFCVYLLPRRQFNFEHETTHPRTDPTQVGARSRPV